MPDLSRVNLDEKLKNDPMGIYLLCGEESFLVRTYADRIVKACVDESFADFNVHIIDAESPDLSEVYDLSLSVPMMAPAKCVSVKNYPVSEATSDNLEQLKDLVKDNPEDNALIFSFTSEKPEGKNFTAMKKIFAQYGFVVDFSKQTLSDLALTLERGAKKRGVSFEKGVARYMVENIGDELDVLQNELEKVCAYCDKTVKKSDVDAVCIKSLDIKVFNMTKALTSGNFDSAFGMLEKLFEQKDADEFMILGALISQYTDIYRAKSAYASGKPVKEIADAFPSLYKGRDFKLTSVKNVCINMSFESLANCLEILADTDRKFKSSQEDKKLILENTLVKLARAKG